uniref:G-protein coupled receptors family 1 profile domain-containing protein n=1 Tax=Plectus sambesii TaxID=2011161 RepID=A0A914XRN7_9BILA
MTNTTVVADPDPGSAMWLGLVWAIYAAIGIPANILVLVLSMTKNVRVHPINICIISIAFSDMMVLVSCLSSIIWALTNDIRVCKVMGVGIYVFVVMSMTLPSCLALCRHVGLVQDLQELHPLLWPLKKRKGIIALNGMLWTYGLLFTLPFILTDRMGLDSLGFCGIVEISSVLLWAYYLVFIIGVLFGAYIVTFIFYRKLSVWAQTASSTMTATSLTNETLALTRNIMRMIRWLLFVPFVFYYPAVVVQTALRISPNLVSVFTARIFVITLPLPHLIDPFVTLFFVKCYHRTLVELISKGRMFFKHSVYPSHGSLNVMPQSNVSTLMI